MHYTVFYLMQSGLAALNFVHTTSSMEGQVWLIGEECGHLFCADEQLDLVCDYSIVSEFHLGGYHNVGPSLTAAPLWSCRDKLYFCYPKGTRIVNCFLHFFHIFSSSCCLVPTLCFLIKFHVFLNTKLYSVFDNKAYVIKTSYTSCALYLLKEFRSR